MVDLDRLIVRKRAVSNDRGEMHIMAKRILIAEDDLGSRELITIHAGVHGYEVVAVTDGVDLLTASTNERFDLIITDLMMKHLDGASATEVMKMQGNTVPVIALTALSPKEIQLVKDKFTKIFHKPCNYKELFEYVESLIGN
jgi:DNA-binding response OmpR family regulator